MLWRESDAMLSNGSILEAGVLIPLIIHANSGCHGSRQKAAPDVSGAS